MNEKQNDEYEEICPGVIKNTRTGEIFRVDTVRDITPEIERRIEFLRLHRFNVKNTQGLSQEEITEIKQEAAKHYLSKEEVSDDVIAVNIWK